MNKEVALQKIVLWGKSVKSIDALLLTGSLAGQGKTDELSDLDIAVFGTDFTFIKNNEWLIAIDDTWVCIHDQFVFEGYKIPTRLTIFNQGLKVDFSFHPSELLNKLATEAALPDAYRNGYKILLDKTGLAVKFSLPDFNAYQLSPPDKNSFQNNENEFWFECYHVAKYLKRNDLWTAKVRDKNAKAFLLEMLQWHHLSKSETIFNPKLYGREMQSWLSKKLWNTLYDCFPNFDKADSCKSLRNMINLYRKVAKEVANNFIFAYNEKLDVNMSSFINALMNSNLNNKP
jgi:aminoglycoside 6-adenylyltransferase